MRATEDGRRGPRCIEADEGEWRRVVERARAAGLPVSRYAAALTLDPGSGDGAQG